MSDASNLIDPIQTFLNVGKVFAVEQKDGRAGALVGICGAIKLTPIDQDFGTLEVAGVPYKPFPRGGFDIERRLKDMDATGVDVHVLSATPQTYLYGMGLAASAIQNDQIAKLVKQAPDRFIGIGTLPLLNGEAAASERPPDEARPPRVPLP